MTPVCPPYAQDRETLTVAGDHGRFVVMWNAVSENPALA
jgi:hypothetical protein